MLVDENILLFFLKTTGIALKTRKGRESRAGAHTSASVTDSKGDDVLY